MGDGRDLKLIYRFLLLSRELMLSENYGIGLVSLSVSNVSPNIYGIYAIKLSVIQVDKSMSHYYYQGPIS